MAVFETYNAERHSFFDVCALETEVQASGAVANLRNRLEEIHLDNATLRNFFGILQLQKIGIFVANLDILSWLDWIWDTVDEDLHADTSPRLELCYLGIYCFLRFTTIFPLLAGGLALLTLLVRLALRLAFSVPLNFAAWEMCWNVDVLVSI
jgi:hypothetical protein